MDAGIKNKLQQLLCEAEWGSYDNRAKEDLLDRAAFYHNHTLHFEKWTRQNFIKSVHKFSTSSTVFSVFQINNSAAFLFSAEEYVWSHTAAWTILAASSRQVRKWHDTLQWTRESERERIWYCSSFWVWMLFGFISQYAHYKVNYMVTQWCRRCIAFVCTPIWPPPQQASVTVQQPHLSLQSC